MAAKYYSIITNRGKALEAASAAGGAPVVLKKFVVGDGNGQAVTPGAAQTALVREVYRGTISLLEVSPEQENQFIAHLSLPEGSGNFTVREVGLLTDNDELYAVGSCAAIEKPVNGVTVTLQFRLAVSESAQITLQASTGDGLFLRQDANLSDVRDKPQAVENLGLKPTVDKAEKAVDLDTVYPVGVVIWFAQNRNPNNLFPGTRWSYIGENKTIRLADSNGSNVLASGGSDTITLTTAHLPAHSHSFSGKTSVFDYGTKTTSTTGEHVHEYNDNYWAGTVGPDGAGDRKGPRQTGSAGNHAHSVTLGAHEHTFSGTTGSSGSGSAVSVVNAYVMLMGWYRAA